MEERRREVVTVALCRCGWFAVAGNFGEVNDLYKEHYAAKAPDYRHAEVYRPVANPLSATLLQQIGQEQYLKAIESRNSDISERWAEELQNPAGGPGDDLAEAVKTWALPLAVLVGLLAMAAYAWHLVKVAGQ